MRNGRFGIGIIGFGGFGQFLYDSWSIMEEVAVRAVADSDSQAQAAFGRSISAPRPRVAATFYSDWQSLLKDTEVDVVSISTPPGTHAEIACAALRAGKHVLIEKPLATSMIEADRIRTSAEDAGRVAAVDYMLRFNPIVETLQRWARDGSFGALRRVIVENYAQDESLPATHWFWDRARSGGILVEHAVHFIDVVNGCTDADTTYVDGLVVERSDGRADRMGLTVVYSDGLVHQQYHAFSRPNFFEQTGMRFVFDLAQFDVEGWIPLSGTVHALVNEERMGALQVLPQFAVSDRRPSGSGERIIRSGGFSYDVDEQVRGHFYLPTSKSEAYASALRSLLADVITAIENPVHRLRAGLPEALRSLEIAVSATDRAFGRDRPRNV